LEDGRTLRRICQTDPMHHVAGLTVAVLLSIVRSPADAAFTVEAKASPSWAEITRAAGASTDQVPRATGARCSSGEGATVDAPLGLVLCQGTATNEVVMYDKPQAGARIADVVSQSTAAKAGLVAGDVIYQIRGVRVTSGREGLAHFGDTRRARDLIINVWRGNVPYQFRIWNDEP
jgi:S1-C subfamily serine protease